MRITLSDPAGGLINLETETCPRKGERVLIRGRKYIAEKIYHEVRKDSYGVEHMATIVDVRLATVDDLLNQPTE